MLACAEDEKVAHRLSTFEGFTHCFAVRVPLSGLKPSPIAFVNGYPLAQGFAGND